MKSRLLACSCEKLVHVPRTSTNMNKAGQLSQLVCRLELYLNTSNQCASVQSSELQSHKSMRKRCVPKISLET